MADLGIGEVAAIASLASGVVGAIGSFVSGSASADAARYQAQVAENNAKIARQNASWATQIGETQATAEGMKTRAIVGAEKAAQAASNIQVNTGSAVDVRSSADELGELSQLTIRSNAARQTYGYQVQSTSYDAQAQLDRQMASQAQSAGVTGAFSSLLGAAGSAGSKYALWQLYQPPAGYGGGYGISTMSGVNNPYTY